MTECFLIALTLRRFVEEISSSKRAKRITVERFTRKTPSRGDDTQQFVMYCLTVAAGCAFFPFEKADKTRCQTHAVQRRRYLFTTAKSSALRPDVVSCRHRTSSNGSPRVQRAFGRLSVLSLERIYFHVIHATLRYPRTDESGCSLTVGRVHVSYKASSCSGNLLTL